MLREAPHQDGFASLRELIREREQYRAATSAHRERETSEAAERFGYLLPVENSFSRTTGSGERSAIYPVSVICYSHIGRPRPPGTLAAFAGGLASAIAVLTVILAGPLPQAEWAHAAPDSRSLEAEPLPDYDYVRAPAAQRPPSADAIAHAIAALRYETASIQKTATVAPEPGPSVAPPEAAGLLTTAAIAHAPVPGPGDAAPASSPLAAVSAKSAVELPAAAAPPAVAVSLASPEPVSPPANAPAPGQGKAGSGEKTPAALELEKPVRQRSPTGAKQPALSASPAQTSATARGQPSKTGGLARLNEPPAHLSGPRGLPKQANRAVKTSSASSAGTSRAKPPAQRTAPARMPPPRPVVIVEAPPPSPPGFFESIGRLFGF